MNNTDSSKAGSQPPPALLAGPLADSLARMDAERLMTHVRRITQFVRTPGETGEREAFAYLEEALRAAGLTPLRHDLPAYVSVPVSAKLSVAGKAVPCTTHSMLPDADFAAELVYIPDAGDISRNAVAGKIVMTDGLAMAPVMQNAQAAGALGMVFIAGSRHWHEMIVSPVWGSPEPKDLNAYIGIPAVTVSFDDGEKVKELMRRDPMAAMRTRVASSWVTLPLITADVGPVENGYCLLTGHVDSWHKGALDNASGNAAAIEIGRILLGATDSLRRGVRLVFWSGHSHGRYAGSAAFCDAFFQDIRANAFLHVNADCLGGDGATLLSQSGCMAETWALGNFAVKTISGEELEGTRFSRSCDQSFWGAGVPSLFSSISEQPKPESDDAASRAFAIMFGGSKSGGYGWWWHTEADTADKLDPAFLCRDARILLAAVFKACSDPVVPFDLAAGFAEFAGHVRAYADAAEKQLDFMPLLGAISRAEKRLARMDLTIRPQYDERRINRFIRRFEQMLVPLLYVKGPLTGHDPALRQNPVPLLEELPAFMAEKNPHTKNAYGVLLRRRLNECLMRVEEINELLADFTGE